MDWNWREIWASAGEFLRLWFVYLVGAFLYLVSLWGTGKETADLQQWRYSPKPRHRKIIFRIMAILAFAGGAFATFHDVRVARDVATTDRDEARGERDAALTQVNETWPELVLEVDPPVVPEGPAGLTELAGREFEISSYELTIRIKNIGDRAAQDIEYERMVTNPDVVAQLAHLSSLDHEQVQTRLTKDHTEEITFDVAVIRDVAKNEPMELWLFARLSYTDGSQDPPEQRSRDYWLRWTSDWGRFRDMSDNTRKNFEPRVVEARAKRGR